MNAFWNGLSEVEFWSLVDNHIHDDYREHYLAEDMYTSYKSVRRLLKHQHDVVGRVLAKLIIDGDIVLSPIDTAEYPLGIVTASDQVIIDNTFNLLETWVDEFATRLLIELDEDQQSDEDHDW